jgi:hypothetical protein
LVKDDPPVLHFKGFNRVLLLGNSKRLFFGRYPKALILTFFLINIPTTIFNILISPVSQVYFLFLQSTLWGKVQYLPFGITLGLQILATVLSIIAGTKDPGIIPTKTRSAKSTRTS